MFFAVVRIGTLLYFGYCSATILTVLTAALLSVRSSRPAPVMKSAHPKPLSITRLLRWTEGGLRRDAFLAVQPDLQHGVDWAASTYS